MTDKLPPMTASRAAYFMERFKKEEKLLGPNEQAAVDFVIEMLEGRQAVREAVPEGIIAKCERESGTCVMVHDKGSENHEPCNASNCAYMREAVPEIDHRCSPSILSKLPPIKFTGKALKAALEMIAPDGTDEQLGQSVCIQWRDEGTDVDGHHAPAGWCAWDSEYPEEGSILIAAAQGHRDATMIRCADHPRETTWGPPC